MSKGSLDGFDLEDDSPRNSIEWLKSDQDAQPVLNVDFLLGTPPNETDLLDSFAASPELTGKPSKPSAKRKAAVSKLSHLGGAGKIPRKGSKLAKESAVPLAGADPGKIAAESMGSARSSSAATQPLVKKVKRLEAHNAAEKRRQQRIAEEIEHIREVLVAQGASVGGTKRELFQATVGHMEDLWKRIRAYEEEAAARASHDDLRVAKMLKSSCTEAMYEIDENFNVTHAFGATADITGHLDTSDLVGHNFLDFVHKDDVQRARAYFRAVFDRATLDYTAGGLDEEATMPLVRRMPAILTPIQIRQEHSRHAYFVPVQISCHSITDARDISLFGKGVDPTQCVRLLFSERSTMIHKSNTLQPLGQRPVIGHKMSADEEEHQSPPFAAQSMNKCLPGTGRMKLLRRSQTWHNSTVFELNNMVSTLPSSSNDLQSGKILPSLKR